MTHPRKIMQLNVARPLVRIMPIALALPVQVIFSRLLKLHPKLFDRLGEYSDRTFRFVLTDYPLAFLIVPKRRTIKTVSKECSFPADAEIEGPLAFLLSLAEGKVDADALFFARDIAVSGDMEAMVALRNALDDTAIDLAHDLAQSFGPLSEKAEKIMLFARDQMMKSLRERWN